MKKFVVIFLVFVTSFCALQADDAQKDHNNVMATNIGNALKKSVKSKEFLEWQVDTIKHMQKGLAIIVKKGKQYLTKEEQTAVKRILLAVSGYFEVIIEMSSEFQLASTNEAENDIRNKYQAKLQKHEDEVLKSSEIFKGLLKDVILQEEHEFKLWIYAFMQRFATAMAVALPVIADELA